MLEYLLISSLVLLPLYMSHISIQTIAISDFGNTLIIQYNIHGL